jgi:peptidoglycan/LPS O-acetylase OafA/YrhL
MVINLRERGQPGTAPTRKDGGSPARLAFFDNLKVALTLLVIAHHVGQAYGPTGGTWPVMEAEKAAFLGPFFTVNRSFFMSLFFFISGFFVVGAFGRHSPRDFVRSRLVRLGIPVLVFMLAMIPLGALLFQERIGRWDTVLDAGHLWYLEHVLLYSLIYAAIRLIRGRMGREPKVSNPKLRGVPGLLPTIACLLVVAAVSGIVRIWSPIDRWFNLLGFFRVAFADVPRDLTFFVLGILAAERDWVDRYPARRGYAWLAVGLIAAIAWYAWILVPGWHFPIGPVAFGISRLLWEGVICFGFCIGLVVLFREIGAGQGRLGKALSANQYSAYFWHPILVVPLQMAAARLPIGSACKFLVVTIVAIPLVFAWSGFVCRSPIVRKVL